MRKLFFALAASLLLTSCAALDYITKTPDERFVADVEKGQQAIEAFARPNYELLVKQGLLDADIAESYSSTLTAQSDRIAAERAALAAQAGE